MVTHDIEGCFGGACGLTAAAHARVLAETDGLIDALRRDSDGRRPAWLALPERTDDLAAMQPVAERWRTAFDDVVIIGTGSACGAARCLAVLADPGFGPARGLPRLHVLDTVDPDPAAALLDSLDLSGTGFIAVSQSGTTPDTLALTLVVLRALIDALPDHTVKRHLAVMTGQADSPLRRLARAWHLDLFDDTAPGDTDLSGHAAPLGLAGLLPALIVGLDAAAVRAGAARMLNETLHAGEPADSGPAVGAALTAALYRDAGIRTTVTLHYVDRLAPLFAWWRHRVAAALGKDGQGLTPVAARGLSDRNSQLPLYLDGPADKLFTLVTAPVAARGPAIDVSLARDPAVQHLAGRRVGDLMAAASGAAAAALAAAGRPVRQMRIGRLDETQLGGLLMHLQLETVLTARLLGVDPFARPAVDHGQAWLAAGGEAVMDESTHPWLRAVD